MESILTEAALILAECAVTERLRRQDDIKLHPTLFNAPLIDDKHGAAALAKIYYQYREIADKASLPILLFAPTWRLDKIRIAEAGFDDSLIDRSVAFMRELQKKWQKDHSPIFIGGLLGPKNDCYAPDQSPAAEAAADFHKWQIERLVHAGVDFIAAQTIPSVSEGLGIAMALGETTIPSLISFVINRRGEVLDNTPLKNAIATIDDRTSRPPLGYMVNCAYPTFICPEEQPRQIFKRLVGIQANSSSLDHTQLEGSTVLHRDNLEEWGSQMLRLHRDFGIKILGGCCGTDNNYLQYLADHAR